MSGGKKKSLSYTVYTHLPTILPTIFFVFTIIVYVHNLTRDIYSGDIGDLVTASYVCGVAHPPGYPLFTLLGCILSRLPLPIPPVTKVGLISALSSLVGLFIYYRFTLRATRNLFISLLSTSILAFSYYFWLHAEIPEVFGLNNFFIIVLIYLAYLFYETKKDKYLYLLALFFGLASAHHHTIIFILPSIFLLIFKHFRFIFSSVKKLFIPIGLFALGLSVYIYVPIVASQNPPINWDNATNLNNLIHLFFRKDYETFGYGGLPLQARTILFGNYVYSIINTFSYQIIFIAVLGLVYLFIHNKRLFFSLLLAFIISGPLFVMYIGAIVVTTAGWGVIERFYIFSSVVFMFFVPYGFMLFKDFIERYFQRKLYTYAALSYFILIPVLLFQSNFPRTNIASTQIGNKLTDDILIGLPKNAILYVNGDTKTFNMWYAKHVLNKRPDVDLINPPGRAGNYYLDKEINEYYKKHPKTKPTEIVTKTLEEIRKRRPIFATQPLEQIPNNLTIVPYGMVYKLIDNKDIPAREAYLIAFTKEWDKIKPPTKNTLTPAERNLITPEIPLLYSLNLYEVAHFMLYTYKDPANAIKIYKEALRIDDENTRAYAGLAMAYLYKNNDCIQATNFIKEAIRRYPIYRTFYAQQYIIEQQCKASSKQLKSLASYYKNQFHQTIDKEVKMERDRYTKTIENISPQDYE